MMTEIKKARRAILMSTRKAIKAKRISSTTGCALKHRLFPLSFFVRNMLALQREPWWIHLSPRVRKTHLLAMLGQRCRIFLEVRKWIRTRQREDVLQDQALSAREERCLHSGYCRNCGGCCEIASGFPGFPPEVEIPGHWQQIFGDGLGKGHRFCAFLWELYTSGQSLCAIHPWRSNTCRVFEEDECEYFMKDLGINALFDSNAFSVACHLLPHLINRR
jgi:hypothetical protein